MIEIDLPYPPSVNHYWRVGRGRVYLSAEGRGYKARVASRLRASRLRCLTGPVSMLLLLHPPDRRRRDLDNAMKALWDAIVRGGVLEDDSQIRHVEAYMLEPEKGGKVRLLLQPLPSI